MVDNARACQAWLNYLEQGRAGSLVGQINKDLLTTGASYSVQNAYVDYYAEVSLLGRAGIDLSAQYCMADFLQGNLLQESVLAEQGELFYRYAQLLQKRLPKVLPNCYCFLEKDTATGDKNQTAIFFNMTGKLVYELAAEVMGWLGYEERLQAVVNCLHSVQPELNLWHLGFMLSRPQAPIRLVLISDSLGAEGILKALDKLGKANQVQLMEPLLRTLESLQLFDFILDIDILPDGTLGNTVGLELVLDPITPTRQHMAFATRDWKQALSLLQQKGQADERLLLLEQCLLSSLAPDEEQEPYYMYSRLSHLKLRWQEQEQLPTKAYLHMKARAMQKCINDIM